MTITLWRNALQTAKIPLAHAPIHLVLLYSASSSQRHVIKRIWRDLLPSNRIKAAMDTLEQFVEKFKNAVDFQDEVELSGDTNLKALPEWDSLAALGVIIMFDMEYNKAITGKDLVQCQLVSDVYKLIG
jgi:acyl carrier protein